MEENFSCNICSGIATHFCICSPEKIYLCQSCITPHIIKSGAHSLAPIEARTIVSRPQDLAIYNIRLETKAAVFASFDRVLTELEQQKGQFGAAIENEQARVVKEVTMMFEVLASEITAMYDSVKSEIQNVKAELKKCDAEFETETAAWISVAMHIDEIVPFFRDVKSIVAQRVSVVFNEASFEAQHPVTLFAEEKSVCSCPCKVCFSALERLQMRPKEKIPEIRDLLWPEYIPAENPSEKPLEVPRIPQQPPEKQEPRAEEAKAIVAEPVPEGPLLQILSLGRNADGKLTATVVNPGTEEIWGYLCVKTFSPQPLSFVGKSEIDMSSWAVLHPGQYDASVLNSVTKVCESNSFTFTIADEQINQPQPPQSEDANFEQCFVNQNVTNMAEVQDYVLTNYGETGLRIFKKIACQWKNPSLDQLNHFLQTIAVTNLQDEAAARQQLEASGFLL